MIEVEYKALEDLYAAGQDGDLIARASNLITIHPGNGSLWKILGASFARAKETTKALSAVRRSLSITPSDDETLWNFASLFDELGDRDSSVHYYGQYVCIDPHRWDGCAILAEGVYGLGHYEQSIAWANRAIEISPIQIGARLTKGSAQRKLARLDQAAAEFSSAVSIDPKCRDAQFNLGSLLLELRRAPLAISALHRVIAIDPGFFGAYLNLGKAAADLKDFKRAAVVYRHALRLSPDHEFLLGACIDAQLNGANWKFVEEDIDALEHLIRADKPAAASLTVLAVTDDPWLQRRSAELFFETRYQRVRVNREINRPISGKIRLGYFSADFRNHPTSHLIAGLLESHDRQRFHVFAFSIFPKKNDWMTERVKRAVDEFIDISNINDEQVIAMCLDAQIDVAIDLMGYTEHCRPAIFAGRCAPIQISYLGYIGSMGVSFIDYVVADPIVVNQDNRESFTEKIMYLPESFQVNDNRRRVSTRETSRTDFGLPLDSFVYCCFNSTYKINPKMFSIWVEILSVVPNSIIWLVAQTSDIELSLRSEAESRGLCPSRLFFSPRIRYEEYLARFRFGDLFLDTFPYNGGATTSDALWAGLPVLTLAGKSFVSRMGKSLLETLGVPELVSERPDKYIELAVAIGRDQAKLANIRQRISVGLSDSPLYDVFRFTKHFESGLSLACERNRLGGEASDIIVRSTPKTTV